MKTRKEREQGGTVEDFIKGAKATQADLGGTEPKKMGRPVAQDKDNYTKSTFVIRKDLQKKVRVAAAMRGLEQKDILEEALNAYFEATELTLPE